MEISTKTNFFLGFFALFTHIFYFLFVTCETLHQRPQFNFHAITKYTTSFPGHVGFLI